MAAVEQVRDLSPSISWPYRLRNDFMMEKNSCELGSALETYDLNYSMISGVLSYIFQSCC